MKVAVIGGGAAGLTAAGSCSGAEVTVFEHSEKLGKKIYITGKGRCNFTNVCEPDEFLKNVVSNAPFLRSAIYKFPPSAAVELLESLGCRTKIERGRRAFPVSDRASDVTKALVKYAENNGAKFVFKHVSDIKPIGDRLSVITADGEDVFDKVIVCSGGKSYSSTGSDGSMYNVMERLGHNVIAPVPSLCGLITEDNLSRAQGLTLKNVSLRTQSVKPIFGDLLITESGISGPIALTLSAYAARAKYPYEAFIDLKPALGFEELDKRILVDFSSRLNKQFKNSLDELLPKSLIGFIIERSGIDGERSVNSVTKKERRSLCEVIKNFRVNVSGSEGFNRAVVTRGGVDVLQINPKTMQSKSVKGLYVAGEVLDVDALTGGYNFHIALATGYAAGASAVNYD